MRPAFLPWTLVTTAHEDARMNKHFDVAIIGASLGTLACAALLARRSFRVLLLGQGRRASSYTHDGHRFERRPSLLTATQAPHFRRLLAELAQAPLFRRRITAPDSAFGVLTPALRFEALRDAALFSRELDREVKEGRRLVDELHEELVRMSASIDQAFATDCVWPPGTFWERRQTHRAAEHLPAAPPRPLVELGAQHPYALAYAMAASFASFVPAPVPPLAAARLFAHLRAGIAVPAGGEGELSGFLTERVRAAGGEVWTNERVVALQHKAGHVRALEIEGTRQPVGVGFVVTADTAQSVLDRAPGVVLPRRIIQDLPQVDEAAHRFTLSLVVRNTVVPEALPLHTFLGSKHALLPQVFLQRQAGQVPGTTLLVAEALFPEGADLRRARERVLSVIEEHLPFVDRGVVACDSVHDGRPLWLFEADGRHEVDRATLRSAGLLPEAEPMTPLYRVSNASESKELHGLAGEPLRGPLAGVFHAGPTVLPALGQEGELIAAFGVARIISRTDRAKEKMRKELWSKLEMP